MIIRTIYKKGRIDKKMKEEGIEGIEKIDLDILYDEQIKERLKHVFRR